MRRVLVLVSLFFLCACATMFGDKNQTITINSEPQGADVYLGREYLGKTPATVTLRKQLQGERFIFKKDGYKSQEYFLDRSIQPVAFWNLGFISTTSGVTSWGIDFLNGTMFRYTRDSFVAKLDKNTAELWDQNVFSYVMYNFASLKKDLARRQGDHLQGLCHLLSYGPVRCQSSIGKVAQVKSEDALSLYRDLQERFN